MILSKKVLKDEISKTKEAIKSLWKIKSEQEKKHGQLQLDCDVGIAVNNFVLEKLEDALKGNS